MNKPRYIIVHCTDVEKRHKGQYWSVNRYHRDVRGFPESSLGKHGGYHKFSQDGIERRYREDWEVGAHCNSKGPNGRSMNFQSLGYGIAFDGDTEMPDDRDVENCRKSIKKWQEKYNIPNNRVHIAPHRKWTPRKTCYGGLLANDWAFLLLNPPQKPSSEKKKREELIKQKKALLDTVLSLLQQLEIMLRLRRRQKIPPKVV